MYTTYYTVKELASIPTENTLIRFSVRPAFGSRGWEVLDHSTHTPVLNSQGRVWKLQTKAYALSFAATLNKGA